MQSGVERTTVMPNVVVGAVATTAWALLALAY